MSDFRIRISTESDAFRDGNSGAEIARILRKYADALDGAVATPEEWESVDILRDINGNKVGTAGFRKVASEPAPDMASFNPRA